MCSLPEQDSGVTGRRTARRVRHGVCRQRGAFVRPHSRPDVYSHRHKQKYTLRRSAMCACNRRSEPFVRSCLHYNVS